MTDNLNGLDAMPNAVLGKVTPAHLRRDAFLYVR